MTNNTSPLIRTFTPPVLADVFCPLNGWTVSRDGFCYNCGATDHETAQD